ncbi:hypothetical protein [Streptomyces genisteinicus]|uniref:Uncharacterized protein n=1 Tax=Streptomyces genisteinicus TaxID=2768068 RepID=A0A7H0HPW3_9ACTN|nr:hypothetical protein [Streptomyces genisteinicus]QNP62579.1 hypothetical protein IAG43_06260 [Streptomyces genisteinicus]
MHTYDPFRQPYQSPIPSARAARDGSSGDSPTPIYDALYSEFRRAFRTLPGDRSGEEELGFRGFGSTGLHSSRGGLGTYSGHFSPVHPGNNWQPYHQVVRPPNGHEPAALPPGPRRGA